MFQITTKKQVAIKIVNQKVSDALKGNTDEAAICKVWF